jgi:hypothetical protein
MNCAWCGAPAVTQIVIEPAVLKMVKGRKELVRPAVWAHACREHRRLSYNPLAQRVAEGAERARRRRDVKRQMTIDDMLDEDEDAGA